MCVSVCFSSSFQHPEGRVECKMQLPWRIHRLNIQFNHPDIWLSLALSLDGTHERKATLLSSMVSSLSGVCMCAMCHKLRWKEISNKREQTNLRKLDGASKKEKRGTLLKNRKRGSVYCLLVLPVSVWAQSYSTPPFHHCRKTKQCHSFPFTYFSARPLFVTVDPVRIPFQTLRAHLSPLHLWGQNLCNISKQFILKPLFEDGLHGCLLKPTFQCTKRLL